MLLEFELKQDLGTFFCFLQLKHQLKQKELFIGRALAYLRRKFYN